MARQVTASETADTRWQVFDTATGDARPRFITVDGINPTDPKFVTAVAAAAAGDAQAVLLLEGQPDEATAAELREVGWRLTDAIPTIGADARPSRF